MNAKHIEKSHQTEGAHSLPSNNENTKEWNAKTIGLQ